MAHVKDIFNETCIAEQRLNQPRFQYYINTRWYLDATDDQKAEIDANPYITVSPAVPAFDDDGNSVAFKIDRNTTRFGSPFRNMTLPYLDCNDGKGE